MFPRAISQKGRAFFVAGGDVDAQPLSVSAYADISSKVCMDQRTTLKQLEKKLHSKGKIHHNMFWFASSQNNFRALVLC